MGKAGSLARLSWLLTPAGLVAVTGIAEQAKCRGKAIFTRARQRDPAPFHDPQ
jgi:hypothetical protein